jgi:hypothetical protein
MPQVKGLKELTLPVRQQSDKGRYDEFMLNPGFSYLPIILWVRRLFHM